jgi:hypothetical protein
MEGPDIEFRAKGSEADSLQPEPKGPGRRNRRFLLFGGDAGSDTGEGSSGTKRNTWDRTEAFDPAATQTPHANLGKCPEDVIFQHPLTFF